ncbi:MAG: dTDP-4-dehydrorhamnose 3,5-epimerase family protein [Paracoccaceae bacterium]|jgi:dTDP-4-dehydrorhamnose 3,5-epimerase
MEWKPLAIPGCYVLHRPVFRDSRGTFCKLLDVDIMSGLFPDFQVRDAYSSISNKNTLRGMHLQYPPEDHYKLITISAGQTLDVLVDLRSNNFGKVDYVKMDARHAFTTIAITKGVAHGFLSFSNGCTLNYLTSSPHSQPHDSGVHWQSIDFDWPIKNPIVSERDMALPTISSIVGLGPVRQKQA